MGDTGEKTYRDSIFRYIFSEKHNFIQLYKSITGKTLKEEEVDPYDLESIVIRDLRNDISFKTKDNRFIIMIEHQSTLNENMPLRCLLYYANIIRKYLEENDKLKNLIYQAKAIKIPIPEFYVVYNGRKGLDEEKMDLKVNFDGEESEFLRVKTNIININYDSLDKSIYNHSKIIYGYSYFIYRINENRKIENNLQEAIEIAKREALERGYLVEYLNRKEFITMITKILTIEDRLEFMKKEGIEQGIKQGIIKEKEETAKNLLVTGMDIDFIIKITGLEKAIIEEIARKYRQ